MVLLDNAASAAQVKTLLPGAGTHVTVVTSQTRLAGLAVEGAVFVRVPPLDRASTVALLTRLAEAPTTSSARRAAERVACLCAGLPIAVNAVAVRLAARDTVDWAATAEELVDHRRLLASLSEHEEETSVRATFDLSYRALPADAARLYRRLALHPGSETTMVAARALYGGTAEECARALRRLLAANLLHETAPGRYEFHALLRLHAREKAETDEDEPTRQHLLDRLLHAYGARADAADRLVRPFADRTGMLDPDDADPGFDGRTDALDWLAEEHRTLAALAEHAADRGALPTARSIAAGLWALYLNRRHASASIRANTAVVRAARERGDDTARGIALNQLGVALGWLGRTGEAHAAFDDAERVWRAHGDTMRLALTFQQRGVAALRTGDTERAIDHLGTALELGERLGEHHNLAVTLQDLARAHHRAGRDAEALPLLRRALRVLGERDPLGRARIHLALGEALTAGDPEQAHTQLLGALERMRELGSVSGEAAAREALAAAARARGRTSEARSHAAAALELFEHLGDAAGVQRVRTLAADLAEPSR